MSALLELTGLSPWSLAGTVVVLVVAVPLMLLLLTVDPVGSDCMDHF